VRPGMVEEDVLKVKAIFDIFDEDKSGTISTEELRNSINSLGVQEYIDKVDVLITNLDKNKDNVIDFEEFLEIFTAAGQ